MDNPFTITVHAKDFTRLGVVRAPLDCSFSPRFNALGVGTVTVAADDPIREWLDQDGARIRVEYRGEHLMSGPIDADDGGLTSRDETTYALVDDWVLLQEVLGWVKTTSGTYSSGGLTPTSLTDDAQSGHDVAHDPGTASGSGYYTFPGSVTSAEGLIKNIINVNANLRLGVPVTVPASSSRGGNAVAAGMVPTVRFDRLEDAIGELLAWSGLGLKVWHDGTSSTATVDVYVPEVWPQILTPESGIIASGTASRRRRPLATRAVVGGPGEDNARAFYGVNDATGLEAKYGRKVEVFRSSTNSGLKWGATPDVNQVEKYYTLRTEVADADKAEFNSYLAAAGRKGLTEGLPTSSLKLELSETPMFHFGGPDGIHLGDMVTARSRGIDFTDKVTGADLTLDANGLTVTPLVGNRADDPDLAFAAALKALAAAQRRMNTGR
jgi:hypothetical protein